MLLSEELTLKIWKDFVYKHFPKIISNNVDSYIKVSRTKERLKFDKWLFSRGGMLMQKDKKMHIFFFEEANAAMFVLQLS